MPRYKKMKPIEGYVPTAVTEENLKKFQEVANQNSEAMEQMFKDLPTKFIVKALENRVVGKPLKKGKPASRSNKIQGAKAVFPNRDNELETDL